MDENAPLLTQEMVAVHLFEELLSLVASLAGPVPLVFRRHVDHQSAIVDLGLGVSYLSRSHRDHPVVLVQLGNGGFQFN